jgi:hypothetical protein
MLGFDPELALDLINESQTANRDRFRPAIVSHRLLAGLLERAFYLKKDAAST